MEDDCRKIQDDEKLAIQSIYKKEARFEVNAWEIWKQLSVALTLTHIDSASWIETTKVSIELRVLCSANYPQIPPNVSLLNPKGISKELIQVLEENLKEKCESLIGSAMILELCSEVQNFLYENTSKKQVDLDAEKGGNSRFGPWHIDENSRLMNDFICMKKLGSGGFGDVLLARNKLDEGNYAIKRIPLYGQSAELNNRIIREVKLFSKLNHPNVVRYYGAWTENAEKKVSDAQEFSRKAEESKDKIPSTRHLYIQMEFCSHGTLRSLIDAEGLVGKTKNAWRMFRQILAGLSYIHKQNMIHRDIKPMNILIDEKNCIKIGDFGLAKRDFFLKMDSNSAPLEANSKVFKQTKNIGTELYMAPELFDTNDPAPYSSKIDVYSTGVVLFEMFYRPLPRGKEQSSILNGLKINIAFPPDFGQEYPQNLQSLAKKFVTMMLQEKAENRPTVDQLLADEGIDVDGEELEGGEANTSVLILGGDGYLNTIHLLDSKAQSWKKLRITLPVGMRDFGAVVLNEEIYIFGGIVKEYTYQQRCYKLKDNGSWMELASMNQKRKDISSSSLVYKGDIWVIGGCSEHSGKSLNSVKRGNLIDFLEHIRDSEVYLKSVEKYDISQDKWICMPEMNYPRYSAAAAVFKDRIFVTGGWNGEYLKSVEMFDPELQKWILFWNLPIGIASHTMLISNSTLSIFGGVSKSGLLLNSVWEMDIEDPKKKWTKEPSFKQPRRLFGIGKLSNGIIVFGGSGGSGGTSEIFDGNEWIDGPKLPQILSRFAYTSIPRSLEESFLKKFFRQEQSRNQQNLMPNAQSAVQTESKVEKQSGGQQNISVLILGGDGYLDTIYMLDSKAQSWKELRITLPVGIQEFGAVEVNEEIYIFGGSSEDCYKLKDNGSWIKLASLNKKRQGISSSSLVYKGDIWVIGGVSGVSGIFGLSEDSRECLKSVEKYDIFQDKWTYMPEMNYPRSNAAAAVFKDRIFVTGGCGVRKRGWNREILKSVEMFDPKLQKWILFCDLPIEVTSHTMLISNSTLSIFGGESEFRRLTSVWEMDIEDPEKKWTKKPSFKHSRQCFGVGKLSNRIIVFGGWIDDWEGNGKTSEIFNENEWIYGPWLPQKLLCFAYTSIPRSLEERLLDKFS